MLAHQIWSYHVTQEANLKILYFVLILHLTLGKVIKFLLEKFSTSEVISQKPQMGGVWKPPVSLGLINTNSKGYSNVYTKIYEKSFKFTLLVEDC